MPDPQEPIVTQIKSTLLNALVILLFAPMAILGLIYFTGELQGWADLPKAISHAMFGSVLLTIGWLGMSSPFGRKARMLIQATRQDEDGTRQELRLEMNDAPPDPGTKRTTTLEPGVEPGSQKVTVKEESKPIPPAESPKP